MAVFTVTSAGDSHVDGKLTFREAVEQATGKGDVIRFDKAILDPLTGQAMIRLAFGAPQIEIENPGLTIDGDADGNGSTDIILSRVGMAIAKGAALTLANVILKEARGASAVGAAEPPIAMEAGQMNGAHGDFAANHANYDTVSGLVIGGSGQSGTAGVDARSTRSEDGRSPGEGWDGVDSGGFIVNAGRLVLKNVMLDGIDQIVGGDGGGSIGGGLGGHGVRAQSGTGNGAADLAGGSGGKGGNGGNGGDGADAGAVTNLTGATLSIENVLFINTDIRGGYGASGGAGGRGGDGGVGVSVTGTGTPPHGQGGAGGKGGDGGSSGDGAGTIMNSGLVRFLGGYAAVDTHGKGGAAGAAGQGGSGGIVWNNSQPPFYGQIWDPESRGPQIYENRGATGLNGFAGSAGKGYDGYHAAQGGSHTGSATAITTGILFLSPGRGRAEETGGPVLANYELSFVRYAETLPTVTIKWWLEHVDTDASDFWTAPGEALPTQGAPGEVTIADGKIAAGVVLTIAQDYYVEGKETFRIHMEVAGGSLTVTRKAVDLTLFDDDVGTAGNDTLYGLDGNDTINGKAGADLLVGARGNDRLNGGLGRDTVDYNRESALLFEKGIKPGAILVNLGNMTVTDTTGGKDKLQSIEVIVGTGLDDIFRVGKTAPQVAGATVKGGAGDDLFEGLHPKSATTRDGFRMFGEAGADTFILGNTRDRFDGGAGRDALDMSAYVFPDKGARGLIWDGADDGAIKRWTSLRTVDGEKVPGGPIVAHAVSVEKVTGTSRGDHLFGGKANETLLGGGGADVLRGGAGKDRLEGGGGADRLDGGAGSDILKGGAGADTFVFDRMPAKGEVDRILDFSVKSDHIELHTDAFVRLDGRGAGLPRAAFHINETGLAEDRNDVIVYNSLNGLLYYDRNGQAPGGAVVIADLGTGLALSHSDFILAS